MSRLPRRVYLRELGPREGFQTLDRTVPTEAKLRLIEMLGATGVPEIELTSFVRPDRVPQMADAEEVIKKFQPHSGVKYTALYLNPQGFERAEAAGKLNNDGWIYLAASEAFLKKNNNITLEEALSRIPAWLDLFKRHAKKLHGVMISTAFGCNYEGPVEEKRVLDILSRVHEIISAGGGAPPGEISLADTMGWGSPEKVRSLVNAARSRFTGSAISLHLHDTRGTGMANVYAGLEEGVSIIDCSVGGMGGCPFAKGAAGNVPTEDVAFLCKELGIETGVSLELLVKAAKFAESLVGAPLPGKLYKSWDASPC